MEQHEIKRESEQIIKGEEKKEWLLPASIVFAAIMISAAFLYAPGQNLATRNDGENAAITAPTAPPVTAKDVVFGDPNAPMTIIEYGDFQCPACVSFFMVGEPLLKKELVETGQAKFVFRPFPIVDQIVGKGTESVDSSLALLCARDQGKFWEMHDGLYAAEAEDEENFVASATTPSPEGNGNLNKTLFVRIAKDAGADVGAFTSCYDARTHAGEIDEIALNAQKAGVSGTPAIVVNGAVLNLDPRAYPTWQSVIEYIKQSAK